MALTRVDVLSALKKEVKILGRTRAKACKADPHHANSDQRLTFELDFAIFGQWQLDLSPETKAAMPRPGANVRYVNLSLIHCDVACWDYHSVNDFTHCCYQPVNGRASGGITYDSCLYVPKSGRNAANIPANGQVS